MGHKMILPEKPKKPEKKFFPHLAKRRSGGGRGAEGVPPKNVPPGPSAYLQEISLDFEVIFSLRRSSRALHLFQELVARAHVPSAGTHPLLQRWAVLMSAFGGIADIGGMSALPPRSGNRTG